MKNKMPKGRVKSPGINGSGGIPSLAEWPKMGRMTRTPQISPSGEHNSQEFTYWGLVGKQQARTQLGGPAPAKEHKQGLDVTAILKKEGKKNNKVSRVQNIQSG